MNNSRPIFDDGFTLVEWQWNLLVIKMSEIVESNMLVAATNIANDQDVTLDRALEIAVESMSKLRAQRLEQRQVEQRQGQRRAV